MVVWPYKLIRGYQLGMAFWTSEHHPNNTDPLDKGYPFVACMRAPCLFNIEEDPTEHVDLNVDPTPAHALVVASISARIAEELDVGDGAARALRMEPTDMISHMSSQR